MYTHRLTSHYFRMRSYTGISGGGGNNGGALEQKRHTSVSGSPKRKAPGPVSPTSLSSPRMTGDYQVLKSSVLENRSSVRKARASLASALDRLGEHHVRQKEYDEAMDAFTESLHEKRSIYAKALATLNRNGSVTIDASSFFDGDAEDSPEFSEQATDEIILTLRNMGNVHSLRGEQDEAMRYYTEVTNLRALQASRKLDSGDEVTLFSGLGGEEDNSTLMSEINEDVKALDDMFRSISFRSRDNDSMPPFFPDATDPSETTAEKPAKRPDVQDSAEKEIRPPCRRKNRSGVPEGSKGTIQ